jgi:glutamyl-tRNA synthetase
MPDNKKILVRFAPSPTGKVHIGNIRTAIFNWLYAKHTNGKFLIRVEDTDIERSTTEAIEKLFECLEWLNIDYAEKPVYQTENVKIHKKAADSLLEKNMAYYPPQTKNENSPLIFRIPWNTEKIPNVEIGETAELILHSNELLKISSAGLNFAQVSKKGKPIPSAASLAGFLNLKAFNKENECIFDINEHIHSILENNKHFELENVEKITFTRRTVQFNDKVKGLLTKPLDSIKDFVIVRSDGTPIFHLANVIDDAEQQISCIIRGDDHVENTYRHIFLFNALGYNIPEYAHLPMIVNKSGKPYSKRDGDAFVGDFKLKGFLPNALFNFLALLGWSPGDDREKMSMQELADSFSLERVLSSPAQFDINKLTNLNSKYIIELTDTAFIDKIIDYAELTSLNEVLEWYKNDKDTFFKVASLMKERTKLLSDVSSWETFFTDKISYDSKTFKKHIKQDFIDLLPSLISGFSDLENFSEENINSFLRSFENKYELSQGKINRPLRVAVTSLPSGPDLVKTLSVLGKKIIIQRLNFLTQEIV